MAKCKNCGASDWEVDDPESALQTWRCKACGITETVHVNFANIGDSLPKNLPPVFTLVGRWAGKPAARQVTELQKLFPRLRAMSSIELMRKSLDGTAFELARVTEEEARQRTPTLEELGLSIELIPFVPATKAM